MFFSGLLITIIGMSAVYTFLILLMFAIKGMGFVVIHLEKTTLTPNDKIAALVAIALRGEENK